MARTPWLALALAAVVLAGTAAPATTQVRADDADGRSHGWTAELGYQATMGLAWYSELKLRPYRVDSETSGAVAVAVVLSLHPALAVEARGLATPIGPLFGGGIRLTILDRLVPLYVTAGAVFSPPPQLAAANLNHPDAHDRSRSAPPSRSNPGLMYGIGTLFHLNDHLALVPEARWVDYQDVQERIAMLSLGLSIR